MKTDFLDNGIPVKSGKGDIAANSIKLFREYCKKLNKKPEELSKKELEYFKENI